ncbi:hypothetical protein GCM10007938_07110 [Vibrio zhanjiangensis]|uniref:Uncharacterized protein n=1 Tax=Vibrio zhanjiangensis TaxID=1046128 RepID=A0ABQ6EV91_9VIBR|nr:hypothetical protein [Vibrio zhanjiangensis]GLT16934.1 hypothetical protein GCM10007938_07110 [Vibrio zhanjiangensis]
MKRLSVFLGGLIMSISAEGLAAGWQTFYNPDGTKWTQAQYQGINGSTFPVVGGGSLTATARINSTKDAVWFDIPLPSNTNPSKVDITINDISVTTWTGIMPTFSNAADGSVTKAVNTKTGMILSFDGTYMGYLNTGGVAGADAKTYPWLLAGVNQKVKAIGEEYQNSPSGGGNPPLKITAGKINNNFYNRLVVGFSNDNTNNTTFVISNTLIANNGEIMAFAESYYAGSASIIRLNPADFEIDNVWAVVE